MSAERKVDQGRGGEAERDNGRYLQERSLVGGNLGHNYHNLAGPLGSQIQVDATQTTIHHQGGAGGGFNGNPQAGSASDNVQLASQWANY